MIEKKYKDAINLKKRLKQRKISIGSWLQLNDPNVSELMSRSNFEWLAVDLEHGAFTKNDLNNIFRAISLGNALPFARVKNDNKTEIQEALEAGACGIIVPNVKNLNQLDKIETYCCWPPNGKRGVGLARAQGYGFNFDSYSLCIYKFNCKLYSFSVLTY